MLCFYFSFTLKLLMVGWETVYCTLKKNSIYSKNIFQRTFTIDLTNSTSTVQSDKVNLNVTINNNSLNIYFTVKEQIAHLFARLEMFMQSSDSNRYDIELINRTMDSCKFFKDSLYEPLMQLIYGIMLEHGNFPRTCPVKVVCFLI